MKKTYFLLLSLLAVPAAAQAALVARFSFESDLSNSITTAGAATATVIGTSSPTPGTTALGPGAPLTGNVLELNGGTTSPDSIRVNINFGQGTNSSLTSLGDNFSVALWYRIDSPFVNGGDARHFLWEGDNSYDMSYNANPSTGNGQSYTQSPDSNTLIPNAGNAGTWYQVVQTYEASGTNILISTYINGVAHATVLNSLNAAAADFDVQGLNIGVHRAEGRSFDGQVDELMIWDNALSASDVASLYASQVPEPSAALLGGIGLLALLRRRRA